MRSHQNRFRLLLIYGLLIAPWVGYGAWYTLQGNSNSPLHWVSEEHPARAAYNQFCELFGQREVVVISWQGCTIDDQRLDRLAEVLQTDARFCDAQGQPYIETVVSGRQQVRSMTGPLPLPEQLLRPDVPIRVTPLSQTDAIKRLQSKLVGSDGKTTCLVIALSPAGLAAKSRLVPLIKSATSHFCAVQREDLHLAGPVIDGYAVDQASQQALNQLAGPSALVILLLSWWGLRSLRAAMLVFGVAIAGQALTLSLVHYAGDQMNALLIVLPPLIQVLAVAGGIHLTNYYFDASETMPSDEALRHAVGRAWLPCVLSAVTTAIGLVSLTVSRLDPIRQFGGYAAVGVLATACMILTLIPAALVWWPLARRPATAASRRLDRLWNRLAYMASKHYLATTTVSLLLLVGCGAFLTELKTSVRIETLFAADSRILADYAWLENHVGELAPLEVVVSFNANCPLTLSERLDLLWKLQQAADTDQDVSATLSAVNFMPHVSFVGSLPGAVQRQLLDSVLASTLTALQDANYLQSKEDVQHWRLTVSASALADLDYGVLLNRLRQNLELVLQQAAPESAAGIALRITGVMPLVHHIQNQLLDDLYLSFLGAVGIVTVVMTLTEGGMLAGLVVMVPNLAPILIVFGLLAFAGMTLDIGSVMTASIALGIAVDDTLHFTTTFRRELAAGLSRSAAVLATYRHCGLAMIQTSVFCGLGMSVFGFSDFVPTQRFSLLLSALLIAALGADLILLPALLCGPCGRLFESAEGTASTPIQTPKFRQAKNSPVVLNPRESYKRCSP
ncbi:MAG: MMPL family transporter [Planctomycetales bacterium]|nr:MMPL family transporter [Planctomycetales bacterium]